MKRLHVHVSVNDLEQAINFYNTLFDQDASVVKDDYAKWLLDDPAINFAISDRGQELGLNHLGMQVDSDEELKTIASRLSRADIQGLAEPDTECCYAHSNKYWTRDPAGIPWEGFHTLGDIETFHGSSPNPVSLETSGAKCCN